MTVSESNVQTPVVPTLFRPARVGPLEVKHRVVLSPMTRLRTGNNYAPLPVVKEFYVQRASVPGTLLISEGMLVAPAIEWFPTMYTEEQAKKWREITDAVHAKGSYIFAQFGGAGRLANPEVLAKQNPPASLLAPSAIPVPPGPFFPDPQTPRAMTKDEISIEIKRFAASARLAIEVAGFDGVELHACNGTIADQFLQDVSNVRDDEYGGSPERRARFVLEVVDAMVQAAGGQGRVGVRLSPWTTDSGMGMKDPIPTYTYLASELRARFPSLAYLHAIEPRITTGATDRDEDSIGEHESLDFLRRIWEGPGRVFISSGGFTRESALARMEQSEKEYNGLVDLVAFGRWFISNPDLPVRLQKGLPLNPYDRPSFYLPGDASGKGYIDYPFYSGDEAADNSNDRVTNQKKGQEIGAKA